MLHRQLAQVKYRLANVPKPNFGLRIILEAMVLWIIGDSGLPQQISMPRDQLTAQPSEGDTLTVTRDMGWGISCQRKCL